MTSFSPFSFKKLQGLQRKMVQFCLQKNGAFGGSLHSAVEKQPEQGMLGRQHAALLPWKPALASSLVLIGVPKRSTGSVAVSYYL